MPDNLMRAALEDAGPRLLYPLPEVRAILGGIGHSTLYELFKANELTKVSIGRSAFVTGESLVAYVDRLSGADVEQNTVRTDGPCEADVEQSTLQCTDPSPAARRAEHLQCTDPSPPRVTAYPLAHNKRDRRRST